MKKGFILYKSLYEPIKALDRNQKGELMEAIFEYQLTGNIIENMNPIVNMAFMFFKNQFDIDNDKYIEKCKKAKESIQKRWNKQNTNEYERIETNTNNTDKREKKEDNSKKTKEESKEIEYIYNLYPSRCDTRKTSTGKTKKNKEQIKKILKDHSKEHLESTIKKYIEESKQAKSYIKNFGTFLNNLPDYEEIEEIDNNKFDYYRFNDEYYGNIRRIEKGGKILKPHEILKIDKIGQRQKQW